MYNQEGKLIVALNYIFYKKLIDSFLYKHTS